MLAYRVIARLDVKGPNLIKGRQMEGLRRLGDPAVYARRYADEGADEILFLDTVASLYERAHIARIVERTAEDVFIPITVGGGIRTLGDIRGLLAAGADKVAINTAAVADPAFIARAADTVGAQAICVSIEAKRVNNGWEAYTDCGRNRTGRCAVAWAEEAVRLGAGEVLLTCVDRDGTMAGAEVGLAELVDVPVPVVLAGGIGNAEHACEAAVYADAIALGSALHYGRTTIAAVKAALAKDGRTIRNT